jgi:hypothetical protein
MVLLIIARVLSLYVLMIYFYIYYMNYIQANIYILTKKNWFYKSKFLFEIILIFRLYATEQTSRNVHIFFLKNILKILRIPNILLSCKYFQNSKVNYI